MIILVLGLSGFIVYDKVLNNKNNNIKDETENKQGNNEIEIKDDIENNDVLEEKLRLKASSKNMTILKYLEDYLYYVPFEYSESGMNSIKLTDITSYDEKICYCIWRYIWTNYSKIDNDKRIMSVEEVNEFLLEYFNFENYDIKELLEMILVIYLA